MKESNTFEMSRQFTFGWKFCMVFDDVWSLNWSGRILSSDVWNDEFFE
jgi:hypothetical protein